MRSFALMVAVCVATASWAEAPERQISTESLGWLAGCWAYVGAEPGSGEHWTVPSGGTLLGTGRSVRNGRTVSHEFLIIREIDGGLEYVASPSGQETTAFRLEAAEAQKLVFSNPDHDFPQRIVYELRPDGVLAARIEGVISGQDRAMDFTMTRTDCLGRSEAVD